MPVDSGLRAESTDRKTHTVEFNWQLETVASSGPSCHHLQKEKIDCDSESMHLQGEGPAQNREASAGSAQQGNTAEAHCIIYCHKRQDWSFIIEPMSA